MRATNKQNDVFNKDKLAVGTEQLQSLLDCGRPTAIQIGTLAGAKIEVGKRILWNVRKISKYLDSIATN